MCLLAWDVAASRWEMFNFSARIQQSYPFLCDMKCTKALSSQNQTQKESKNSTSVAMPHAGYKRKTNKATWISLLTSSQTKHCGFENFTLSTTFCTFFSPTNLFSAYDLICFVSFGWKMCAIKMSVRHTVQTHLFLSSFFFFLCEENWKFLRLQSAPKIVCPFQFSNFVLCLAHVCRVHSIVQVKLSHGSRREKSLTINLLVNSCKKIKMKQIAIHFGRFEQFSMQ